MTFLSKRNYRPNGDYPFEQGAYIIEALSLGPSSGVPPNCGRNQFGAAEIERGSTHNSKDS
jgi:hypothetical protein